MCDKNKMNNKMKKFGILGGKTKEGVKTFSRLNFHHVQHIDLLARSASQEELFPWKTEKKKKKQSIKCQKIEKRDLDIENVSILASLLCH